MVCHTLNDKGGKVGPVLTVSALIPKSKSSPPSSIPTHRFEANFRLWLLKDKRRLLFQGRLESESQTSVELLDTEGKPHTIERKDIKLLTTNNQSIMPEGLTEKMTPDELKACSNTSQKAK